MKNLKKKISELENDLMLSIWMFFKQINGGIALFCKCEPIEM